MNNRKSLSLIKTIGLIKRYLKLHSEAKTAGALVEELKPVFFGACDRVTTGAPDAAPALGIGWGRRWITPEAPSADQISFNGFLIYRTERRTWNYNKSAAIRKLENALTLAKKQYERHHAPDAVAHSWAVKKGA